MGGCQVVLKVTLVFFFFVAAYEVSIKKKTSLSFDASPPHTDKHKQTLKFMEKSEIFSQFLINYFKALS